MKIFDTHCHLNAAEYDLDRDLVVERSLAASVCGMALITADLESLDTIPELARDLQKKFSQKNLKVVWSMGLHPHEAKLVQGEVWDKILRQAKDAFAIGETGLDYHYMHSTKEEQQEAFRKHIELALELQKPLILHCREAVEDLTRILEEADISKRHSNPGIMHCFAETNWEQTQRLMDLGFYFSFSGILCFKNADALRSIAARIPVDRLLIETDSPWLAPPPYRGKRNEPGWTAKVLDQMHLLHGSLTKESLAERLWQNSLRVYNQS